MQLTPTMVGVPRSGRITLMPNVLSASPCKKCVQGRLDTLYSAQYRLCGRQYAICHDEAHTKHGKYLEYSVCQQTPLEPASNGAITGLHLVAEVSLYLDGMVRTGVTFHNIALDTVSTGFSSTVTSNM